MNNQLISFTLGEQRYALRLSAVDRVVRAVEINPLPQAPEIVTGIINFHGQVIPAINIRRRFRLPERDIMLSDCFIIARTPRRAVALLVDAATDVIEYTDQNIAAAESILPGMEYIEGVVKLQDGLVLIHDLDKLLSLEEESSLTEAMKTA